MEKYATAREVTYGRTIRRMRFACRITKATDTNSQYVILIVLPRQRNYVLLLTPPSSPTTYPAKSRGISALHKICTGYDTLVVIFIVSTRDLVKYNS